MLAGTDPPASMEQRRRRPDRVIALLESATSASDAWNCDGDIGGVSLPARGLSSPPRAGTPPGRDPAREPSGPLGGWLPAGAAPGGGGAGGAVPRPRPGAGAALALPLRGPPALREPRHSVASRLGWLVARGSCAGQATPTAAWYR